MNTPNPSPFAALLAAQLNALFANGLVEEFVFHRAGVAGISFLGVVDQFPARLAGVNPGDLRVRVRAADLAGAVSPGSPDYVTDSDGAPFEVVSAAIEFGGAGLTLQCRRKSSVQPQAGQAASQALLLPCFNRAERDGLTGLTAGAAIFQTDNTPGLRVFNGANWVRFTETNDL